MEAYHIAHGYGEEPEGVIVFQVLLGRKGNLPDVFKRVDIIGGDAGVVQQSPVKPDGVVHALDNLFQPLQLQGLQCFARQRFKFLVENHDVISLWSAFLTIISDHYCF